MRDLGVPVFTVGVGTDFTTDENMTNLAILSVDSPNVAYVNNSVSMTVSVGAFNVPERRKFARLRLLSGDEEIDAKNFRMPESGTVERVSMDFTPSSTGFNKYKLKLDTLSEESILRDNERDVYIDVREPRLRVLYIEGVLRSEYGFIRRTLETDPDVRITSLVRTRKDSFLLQGAKAEADLSRGLPDKEEDFESFDVVLLGDVPAATFREYQVKNLVKWVDEGHGLMMTGGHNAFYHGGWHETELARALPVRMSSRDAQVSDPLIVQLTPAGLNHPIFKGLDFSSAAMRDGKGALGGCSEPDGVKSGASVLAHGKTARGKKHILCAVHKFGSGRVAVFTGDTTGKANRELVGLGYKSPYPDFWSQMIRWLAGFDDMRKEKDVYLKLAMESRFVKAGSTVEIRSEVSDNKGKLTSTPSVELTVESPAGETSELSHSIDHKSLTGSASFAVSKVGLHKVSGVMTDAGGTELDRTEYYFLAGQPWLENSNLSLDEPSLKRLARETCGRYYNVVSAAQIPQDIARSRGKGVERVTVSLWNNPFVFLALLALLAIEWFVRRRKQLL
ncbi:MAG: glutamine amidotransferase [Planctomycetota bacterium]|nr:glutamine amidotransferase [Planctomycetota bacterium]